MKLAKQIFLSSAIAASAVFATQANATLITDWEFDLVAGWTGAQPVTVTQSGVVTGNGVEGFDTLSWGDDFEPLSDGWDTVDVAGGLLSEDININTNTTDDQSALFIQNPTILNEMFSLTEIGSTGVFSSGNIDGTLFYHLNNVISAGGDPSLTSASLSEFFELTGNGIIETITPTFSILFEETPNTGGTCVPGSGSICDDIFVITNPELLLEQFTHMGFLYTLVIGAEGLGTLSDEACTEAGVATGCIGLLTQETDNNPVQFFINLSAVAIPTPASLALLGAGLLGLGAFARKQRKES